MPRFRYRALDASGRVRAGVIDAASSMAVAAELENTGVLPIEISDAVEPRRSLAGVLARGPRREEITGVTQDLATLLRGGLTLDRALLVLSETSARPSLARLMLDLHRAIARGGSLAESISAHPAVFPRTYVKMVEAAEAAGTLGETLDLIAHERTRAEGFRRRMSSALAYPAFLVVAATGVLVFVLMAIIPEFERALTGMQASVQGSTRLVFALSQALRANTGALGTAAILVLLGALLAGRSHAVKSLAMRLAGRIPGVRQIVLYERAVSFCSTLATLSRSGVDISAALRLIRDLMRDKGAAERVDGLVARVRQGQRLSDALTETELLPPYAVHMLRVGEESGELAAAAQRIAGFYEGKLDRALTRLTAILAPAIMILVSMLIAWLIISVITALLSVNDLLL